MIFYEDRRISSVTKQQNAQNPHLCTISPINPFVFLATFGTNGITFPNMVFNLVCFNYPSPG